MRTSIVLLGLVAMAAVVSADMCLTRVNYLNEGDACDVSSAPCRHSTKLSLYCSSSGVCTKTVDAGASCTFNATVYNQSPCSDQLTCIAGTCVANAGPGMVCTSSLYNDTSMPFCARPFSCISNMCQFGSLGDACTNNTGCSSNMCSGGVCVGKPIGQNCTSDTECGLLSFCDRYTDPFNMTNWLCRAAIPTGANCSSSFAPYCAPNNFCRGSNLTDPVKTCQAYFSLAAGTMCSSNTDCMSKRCSGGYCAAARVDTCGACTNDETCACGSSTLLAGYGKCTSNACYDKWNALVSCYQTACGTCTGSNSCGYPGALNSAIIAQPSSYGCTYLNCKSQLDAYNDCAGAAQVVASLFMAIAAVVAARFVSSI